MPNNLPLVVGAALKVEDLHIYRDWLFEKDRDLEIQSFYFADILDGDWQPLAQEAKRLLDGFGGRLGIHGPFWGFEINSLDPAIRAVVTRRMMQGLDICAFLGATQMVIHSPYTPWDYNNLPQYADGNGELIAQTHATLGTVVSRAEDIGVTLVVENIYDKDAHQRNTLIDSFGSPAIRASVDTGHAQIAHKTQGAQPVDYFIKIAGQRLEHVHLQDVDGYADRHWQIGLGSIHWEAVFQQIAALEQRPRLVLELLDPHGIPASMQYLSDRGLAE